MAKYNSKYTTGASVDSALDKAVSSAQVQDGENCDLDIKDENGNAIAVFKNGHIKTKNFDSSKVVSQPIRIATLGDSITSNQVTNIGGKIVEKLSMSFLAETTSDGSPSEAGNVTTEFGNLACGWATCADYYQSGTNMTEVHLLKSKNSSIQTANYNTMSNQVRRLLQHTTANGNQVSWTHKGSNEQYSIDTSYGVGKGYTSDIPDIIYIAISTNDNVVTDDYDIVIAQNYGDLKRDTICSAMRWAVETLQSAYPNALIVVATPLVRCDSEARKTQSVTKTAIIKKICGWLGVPVIDSHYESGLGEHSGVTGWMTGDGCHPNDLGAEIVSNYVCSRIKSLCYKLK